MANIRANLLFLAVFFISRAYGSIHESEGYAAILFDHSGIGDTPPSDSYAKFVSDMVRMFTKVDATGLTVMSYGQSPHVLLNCRESSRNLIMGHGRFPTEQVFLAPALKTLRQIFRECAARSGLRKLVYLIARKNVDDDSFQEVIGEADALKESGVDIVTVFFNNNKTCLSEIYKLSDEKKFQEGCCCDETVPPEEIIDCPPESTTTEAQLTSTTVREDFTTVTSTEHMISATFSPVLVHNLLNGSEDMTPALQQTQELAGVTEPACDRGSTCQTPPEEIIGDCCPPRGSRCPKDEPGRPGDRGATGPSGGKPGDEGLQGPKGDKGDMGEPGAPGCDGPSGPKGESGLKGEKGESGITGPPGHQGLKGEMGPQGPRAEKGESGKAGKPGPKGEKGDQGIPGRPGIDGVRHDFDRGKLKGDKGDQGLPGVDGLPGHTGAEGPKGSPGVPGPCGPLGPRGKDGERGQKGSTGSIGPAGIQGPPGVTGPPGREFFFEVTKDCGCSNASICLSAYGLKYCLPPPTDAVHYPGNFSKSILNLTKKFDWSFFLLASNLLSYLVIAVVVVWLIVAGRISRARHQKLIRILRDHRDQLNGSPNPSKV